MTPRLTPEQQAALRESAGPALVEDGGTLRLYYLIDQDTLDAYRRLEDLAAIREGIADVEAGRVLTLDELDARVRARLRPQTSE